MNFDNPPALIAYVKFLLHQATGRDDFNWEIRTVKDDPQTWLYAVISSDALAFVSSGLKILGIKVRFDSQARSGASLINICFRDFPNSRNSANMIVIIDANKKEEV